MPLPVVRLETYGESESCQWKPAGPHAVFDLTWTWFRCKTLILNKNDLFESQIQTSHIVDFFLASVTLSESHDGVGTEQPSCPGL